MLKEGGVAVALRGRVVVEIMVPLTIHLLVALVVAGRNFLLVRQEHQAKEVRAAMVKMVVTRIAPVVAVVVQTKLAATGF